MYLNGEIALKSGNIGPSASGAGTFQHLNNAGEEIIRHFSFHAKTMPNGNVKGNGVLTKNGGVVRLKFDIDCLSVEDNIATMTGVITHFSTSPELEGYDCWFKVVDNGEGSNCPADQMTLLYFGDGDLNDLYKLQVTHLILQKP